MISIATSVNAPVLTSVISTKIGIGGELVVETIRLVTNTTFAITNATNTNLNTNTVQQNKLLQV